MSVDPATLAKQQETGAAVWTAEVASGAYTPAQVSVGAELLALDQAHLFSAWPAVSEKQAEKYRFLDQVARLADIYAGGVRAYVERARVLLRISATNANPYTDFAVGAPCDNVRLDLPGAMTKFEAIGLTRVPSTAFVLVAGGLGERLGYNSIKIGLPVEITTGMTYIELYIRWILALQQRARENTGNAQLELQFAIMTSDDTDALTRQLLEKQQRYGMSAAQLTLFKQGKVPSMSDSAAHLVLSASDPFTLECKPHGHGDVHSLLYLEGIAERWVTGNGSTVVPVEQIVFFQDTNALMTRAVVAALGVSHDHHLHMNTIGVPRVQGDAIGGMCTLVRKEATVPAAAVEPPAPAVTSSSTSVPTGMPSKLVIAVEYNQILGLLDGSDKEPTLEGSPISIFPGNTNMIILNAVEYLSVLKASKGVVNEFTNPKYAADGKSFKKPTRLETMMQDWPKLLPQGLCDRVGFSFFLRSQAFSAVKNGNSVGAMMQRAGNAPEVPATGERDQYGWCVNLLRGQCGAQLLGPVEPPVDVEGVQVAFPPHIVFTPNVGITEAEIASKFTGNGAIALAPNCTLVVDARNIRFESLRLEGTLILAAASDAHVTVRNLTIANGGWRFVPVGADALAVDRLRGYVLQRDGQACFVFPQAGDYILSDETRHLYEVQDYHHPIPRMAP